VWQRRGRVSDYFSAIRSEKERRLDSRRSRVDQLRQLAIRRFGSDPPNALTDETLITVRRQPGHPGAAVVSLKALRDFHLREVSGGVRRNLGRPALFASLSCDDIPENNRPSFGHSCAHGPGPHEILVCINKSDNPPTVFGSLLARSRVRAGK
jgi:hypothetical protein